jgi:hypothetical protein
MARITAKQLNTLEHRLNIALGRPTEAYVDGKAQVGHVHFYQCNGYRNVYEMHNEAGGVKGLAYGLTAREAYEWISGALTALRLANHTNQGF